MKRSWRKTGASFVFALAAVLLAPAAVSGICPEIAAVSGDWTGVMEARADVIWEPDDPFYTSERWEEGRQDDFVYNGRSYFANGEPGYIYVVENPENGVITDGLENGTVVYISFTYETEDGAEWGVIQYQKDEAGEAMPDYTSRTEDSVKTGWVRMGDLSLVYDSQEFQKEYESEISQIDGKIQVELEEGEELQYWSYPGSGSIVGSTPKIDENLSVQSVYTDSDGREWGYVGYYYGARDFWICISDPAAKDLPVHTADPGNVIAPQPVPEELPATMSAALGIAEPEDAEAAGESGRLALMVLALALLSIASSGAVIGVMYRRRKRGETAGKEKEEGPTENGET